VREGQSGGDLEHWQPCDLRGNDVSVLRAPVATDQSGATACGSCDFSKNDNYVWNFLNNLKTVGAGIQILFHLKYPILCPMPPSTASPCPLGHSCVVLLSLYLSIHSNFVEKAVITKLLVAYLVKAECYDKIGTSMIFVENVERENCFGLKHFKPNIECPFQN
jgi:hypothetical protein